MPKISRKTASPCPYYLERVAIATVMEYIMQLKLSPNQFAGYPSLRELYLGTYSDEYGSHQAISRPKGAVASKHEQMGPLCDRGGEQMLHLPQTT